jgi:hypothetical protein
MLARRYLYYIAIVALNEGGQHKKFELWAAGIPKGNWLGFLREKIMSERAAITIRRTARRELCRLWKEDALL